MMRWSLLFVCLLGLSGCAVTQNGVDLAQVMAGVDRSELHSVNLFLIDTPIRTSGQALQRIFTLHHAPREVSPILQYVIRKYGFTQVAAPADNVYELELLEVFPDGGACFTELADAATRDATYGVSVMTVGLAPAAGGHCIAVKARLFYNSFDGRVLVGEYQSSAGRIDVYASATSVDVYARSVDRVTEEKAIAASLGGLFNAMMQDGVF